MPTPLTISYTPGYDWPDDDVITIAKLRLAANPTIALTGTISTSSIGDGSITTAKYQDASVTAAKLAATLDLSGKTLTLPANVVTFANIDANFIADATAKTTPVVGDLLLIGDSADSNNSKKSTITQASTAIATAIAANTAVSYASSETALSAGAVINTAHGLGGTPKWVRAVLKCTDAAGDASYAQNDEVDISAVTVGGNYQPFVVGSNATNVFLTLSRTTSLVIVNKGGTTEGTTFTASKWKAIIYARV